MLLGPIFSLEMVTSVRRARYFVLRVVYAAVLLLALFSVYGPFYEYRTEADIGSVANFAAAFFAAFAWLQLLAVVLFGPALAAGTIATERERRTIEYLFASPLSNLEIVLGKLAARLLHVVCLVLVGVPVLSLAMLMGGIAPQSIAQLTILTASTAATVAILSIAISVWSARAREAVTRAYLVIMALLIVPPLVMLLSRAPPYLSWLATVCEPLVWANPFFVLILILTGGIGPTGPVNLWETLWILVGIQFALNAVALTAALFALRRAHVKQWGAKRSRRHRLMQFLRPAVGDRAMLWKEVFAEPAAARLGMVGRVALALILLCLLVLTLYFFLAALWEASFFNKEWYLGYTTFIGVLVSLGGLLMVAARAAGSITSEKERDCWEVLLSTPLEAGQIIGAKVLGNLAAFRGLLVVLAIFWIPGAVLDPGFLMAIPFFLGTLLVLALFASTLGVLLSLRARSSLRAMCATLGICLFVGGGYMFCCFFGMLGSGPGRGGEAVLTLCVPYLLAFPGMVYMKAISSHEEAGFAVAYVIGMVAYLTAALVLYFVAVEGFDGACGRTGLARARPLSPDQEPPILATEVGEEQQDGQP